MDNGLKALVATTCFVVISVAIYMVWPHQMTLDEKLRAIDQSIIEMHQADEAIMND